MAWTTISLVSTGELATASVQNAQVLGNLNELRTGGIAVASQAQYDLLQASSASQWARIAGAANAVLVTDGSKVPTLSTTLPAVDGSALTGISIQVSLLAANSGTTTTTSAENVDTVAISGLTAKDRLIVYAVLEAVTQNTASYSLYNVTDSVTLAANTGGDLIAGEEATIFAYAQQAQSAATTVVTRMLAEVGSGERGNGTTATFTTAWTGSWTLALRHGGVTSGGTLNWSWAVYKLAGQ